MLPVYACPWYRRCVTAFILSFYVDNTRQRRRDNTGQYNASDDFRKRKKEIRGVQYYNGRLSKSVGFGQGVVLLVLIRASGAWFSGYAAKLFVHPRVIAKRSHKFIALHVYCWIRLHPLEIQISPSFEMHSVIAGLIQ